jgi:predicted molibdopterin-dependent oxidoreductase YjgC
MAAALDRPWAYSSAAGVMDEIARVAPEHFGGVSHDRLSADGLQWPCPRADHPGTATVHAERFVRGQARLSAIDYVPSPEQTDDAYPYLLITGRRLEQFNVGTMTRRSPNLELAPTDLLDIHPDDAADEGLANGERVEVVSRWGAARVPVRYSAVVLPGTLFATFHDPATHVNRLTSPYSDPQSKCPEYKVTAVCIRRA